MIDIRRLARGDTLPLADIDRSEFVDGIYRVHDGVMRLDPANFESPGWSASDNEEYDRRVRALQTDGGHVVAAWDGDRLVGFATLDASGVGGEQSIHKLDMLYVSRSQRGQGIGRRLTTEVRDIARALGAASLYISATPTRATVDAYLRLGARVLARPDPELFAQEPEDVMISSDGRFARDWLKADATPVRWTIIGIRDDE